MAHTETPYKQYGNMIYSPGNGVVCQMSTIHPSRNVIEHEELNLTSPDWKTGIETAKFIVTACNSHDELLAAAKDALFLMDQLNDLSMEKERNQLRAAIAKSDPPHA